MLKLHGCSGCFSRPLWLGIGTPKDFTRPLWAPKNQRPPGNARSLHEMPLELPGDLTALHGSTTQELSGTPGLRVSCPHLLPTFSETNSQELPKGRCSSLQELVVRRPVELLGTNFFPGAPRSSLPCPLIFLHRYWLDAAWDLAFHLQATSSMRANFDVASYLRERITGQRPTMISNSPTSTLPSCSAGQPCQSRRSLINLMLGIFCCIS